MDGEDEGWSEPDRPRGGLPRPWRSIFGGALFTTLGIWFWFACDRLSDFADGLAEMAFRGLCFVPFAFVFLTLIFWSISRLTGRSRLPLFMGIFLGLSLAGYGLWNGQPEQWMRRLDIEPPAHMTNLSLHQATSFSDGGAYLFAFTTTPEEFDKLIERLKLGAASGVVTSFEKDANSADIENHGADSQLIKCFKEHYVPPKDGMVWRNEAHTVVANRDRTRVYLYVDRWMRP